MKKRKRGYDDDQREAELVTACDLRFDGYRYAHLPDGQGLDSLILAPVLPQCPINVDSLLHIQPETRGPIENEGEPKRHVCRDRAALVHYLIDGAARPPEHVGKLGLRYPRPWQKVFSQYCPRMRWLPQSIVHRSFHLMPTEYYRHKSPARTS